MTTEITYTHSYSSSVKHAEGFPSRAVWKRRQTSCPFHVEGELPSLSRCVGRALAWGSLGAKCRLRRQAPAHVTERSTRGGGFVSPAARSWGPGQTVGVSLQAGSLAPRRAWALGLCPHPRVSLWPRSPCACPSPMSQGTSRGAVHPPWSPEPRALAVFWVLEAVGENRPASSLDLLFLSLAGWGLSRHR